MGSPIINITGQALRALQRRARRIKLGRTAKGGSRTAAESTSAAAPPPGGGGGAATLPLKPNPVGTTVSILRAIRGEGAKGKDEDIRKQFLLDIIRKEGAARSLIDLLGTKAALKDLIEDNTEPLELRGLAGQAYQAIQGQEFEASDKGLCLEALKEYQEAWAKNTPALALDYLKRGDFETQLNLIRLIYHEALNAKNAAGSEAKASVPPALLAAVNEAKLILAGIAPGNGGDPIKKAKGGEAVAKFLIDNLQGFHVQDAGPGVATVAPFTFSNLMRVLVDGAYAPEIREAARTVLASHFIYQEAEIKSYVRLALESRDAELVGEALKTLNLLYFALDRVEEKTDFMQKVADLYLETFTVADPTNATITVRTMAEETLLRMTAERSDNPLERATKKRLASFLEAYVAKTADPEKKAALAELKSSVRLEVKEPDPSGKKIEIVPEPDEKKWEDFLATEIKGAEVDVAGIMLNETPLPKAQRKRAALMADEWGRDPYLKGILGKMRKVVAGLVEGQEDLDQGPTKLQKAGPNAAEVAELSPPTGNLESFTKLAVYFRNILGAFFNRLRLLVLTDAGEGTRNSIASMYRDQRKGGIPFFKRSLTFLSTMPSILLLNQLLNAGKGLVQLCSSDNVLLVFDKLRTTAGETIKDAMDKQNAHIVFFGARAEYEGHDDGLLEYLQQLGQIVIGRQGEIDVFMEKPKLPKLREAKRAYVVEKFDVELAREPENQTIEQLLTAICTEGTRVGKHAVSQKLAEHVRTKGALKFFQELAEASKTKEARNSWKRANSGKLGIEEDLADDLISIADQLIYTYINTFNFAFSQEMLDLISHYCYRVSPTTARPIAEEVGNHDFSKRFSENMQGRPLVEWEAKYKGEKEAYEKGKTEAQLKTAPFATLEDWNEQWYLARAAFLLSGLSKDFTRTVFKDFRKKFSSAKDLFEYVAKEAGVDAKGKHSRGGKVLVGVVDYFADIGSHLELELRKQEVFGWNRTMRNIFRWLGGISLYHNIEAGARFGNWELLEDSFEIEDKDGEKESGAPGLAAGLGTTVTIKIRDHSQGGRETEKRVDISRNGRVKLDGVVIEDIRTTYVDNKSTFSNGATIGHHSSFVCATITPPKEYPVTIPAYVTVQGAKITGPIEFHGQTGRNRAEGRLKAISIYDFIHEKEETFYDFFADTVVARIHLLSLAGVPLEGQAVVPLAQNAKENNGKYDPVLEYYLLNGSGLTKTQAYWGLGMSLEEFKGAFAPGRVREMKEGFQPEIVYEIKEATKP